MIRLNVQVSPTLFDQVNQYADKYHISRASAVALLLSFALENAQRSASAGANPPRINVKDVYHSRR